MCALLVLSSRGARTGLSTHDTAPHTLGDVRTRLIRHVSWKVHQVIELGNLCILELVNIALELGWDGRLDGNTLALGV